jgi:hypothetical protein
MSSIQSNMSGISGFIKSAVTEGAGKLAEELNVRADAFVEADKASKNELADEVAVLSKKLEKYEGAKKNLPIKAKKDESVEESVLVPPEEIDEKAESFQQQNSSTFTNEKDKQSLKNLAKDLATCKSADDVINLIKNRFSDSVGKQKEALKFLASISLGSLKAHVEEAQAKFETDSTAAARNTADLYAAEEAEDQPASTLQHLTDQNGEPLTSVAFTKQTLEKFPSLADMKKDLDQIQHVIGKEIKTQDAIEALLVNLGKEGQAAQDTRALLNIASSMYKMIDKQCMMQQIDTPRISVEELIKALLVIVEHPRISSEKVISIAHSVVGSH